MKRSAALAVITILFFAMPVFSEAKNHDILHNTFQVKSAEIFYLDEGVFIKLSLFQPASIYEVTVPAEMLKVVVSSETAKNGTHLALTYTKIDSMWASLIKPIKATIWVSQKGVEKKWLDRIGKASKQYRELKNKEVIPTIKK